MNKSELSTFRDELEKKAFVGKVMKRLFFPRKPKSIGERAKNVGRSLFGTGAIVGTLGLGGLAYGAVKKPRSIRSSHPAGFRY